MQAEVIFTGTELLLGQTLNTNAMYLQRVLASLGIDLYFQVTVGDNLQRLKEAIDQARARAELIIICGGLGPTEDDVTREALAEALGLALVQNDDALRVVRRLFDRQGITMSPNNLKQALAPEGALILDNPIGTAPGMILDRGSQLYILLPGPPEEFTRMIDREVVPFLKRRLKGKLNIIKSRTLKFCGIGESEIDRRLSDLMKNDNPALALSAKFLEIHLRITAKASSEEEADDMLSAVEAQVRERLGEYIFGTEGENLPRATAQLLAAQNLTFATIETVTGGLFSHLLNSGPAENYFVLGLVAGRNAHLHKLIDIDRKSIEQPASKESAGTLAETVKNLAGADVGIALTGNPGDNDIFIGTHIDGRVLTGAFKIWGNPEDLAERACMIGLTLLWRTLKNRNKRNKEEGKNV